MKPKLGKQRTQTGPYSDKGNKKPFVPAQDGSRKYPSARHATRYDDAANANLGYAAKLPKR